MYDPIAQKNLRNENYSAASYVFSWIKHFLKWHAFKWNRIMPSALWENSVQFAYEIVPICNVFHVQKFCRFAKVHF